MVKFWFSVSRAEQRTRFLIRQIDPVRQWKLSPMDLASLDRWDEYTAAKEAMFATTDTAVAPWTVVKSNDKKRARLAAMRHVLHQFPYPGKDNTLATAPIRSSSAPPARWSNTMRSGSPSRGGDLLRDDGANGPAGTCWFPRHPVVPAPHAGQKLSSEAVTLAQGGD